VVAAGVRVDRGLGAQQAAVKSVAEAVPVAGREIVRAHARGEQGEHCHDEDDQRAREHERPCRLFRQARQPQGRGSGGGDQNHEHAAPHRRVVHHAEPVRHGERGEGQEHAEPQQARDVLVDPGGAGGVARWRRCGPQRSVDPCGHAAHAARLPQEFSR
jgi:hypothetical protein